MMSNVQTSPVAKESKLLELEGLRGMAALFVVFSHLQAAFFKLDFARYLEGVATLPWPLNHVLPWLSVAPFNGRFCVWVFWTLSGFALSYRFFVLRNAQSMAQSRSYLVDAALRRYPRLLLPVVAATLFAYALYRFGWMEHVQLSQSVSPPGESNFFLMECYNFVPTLSDALYSAFWSTFFSFHVPPSYDPPLWTMKREIFGSFFIFGFLALCGGYRWRWPVYLVAGSLFLGLHQIWLDSFLAGIVLCDLRVNHFEGLRRYLELRLGRLHTLRASWALAVLGTAVLMAAVGYFSHNEPGEINSNPTADFSYIFLSILTIALVQYSLPMRRLFASPCLAYLGKISFGIYISHFPLVFSFSAGFYLFVVPYLGHLPAAWLTIFVTIPAVIGLGAVFYYLADKPSVPLSKWIATSVRTRFGLKNGERTR